MAERGKPWHVCDDCLEPLAGELFALAQRFRNHFDVTKSDRLESEYRQIQEESAYCDDRLTEVQRNRCDELLKQMSAQKAPPRPFDVECLYRDYKIDLATDWLKINISVDYAADFHRTLTAAQKRFSSLYFKACQIINGDLEKESTTQIRYAIQRLIDRHYELLREQFPNHESHPDRDELPDDLRAFEVEILDEYTIVEQEFRKAAEYLRRVSALVRPKLAKAQATFAVGLIDRLLDSPEHVELTPSQLAMLEAYLKQPGNRPSLGEYQSQARGQPLSQKAANLAKLRLIRDFNRNLRAASPAASETEPAAVLAAPSEATAATLGNDSSHKSPTGFLGGAALADALGIHATRRDAFFRQLERQRLSLGDDCWHEVREPRPNSPRFLYRADSAMLRDLATGYKTPKPIPRRGDGEGR